MDAIDHPLIRGGAGVACMRHAPSTTRKLRAQAAPQGDFGGIGVAKCRVLLLMVVVRQRRVQQSSPPGVLTVRVGGFAASLWPGSSTRDSTGCGRSSNVLCFFPSCSCSGRCQKAVWAAGRLR